jgi:hypothetical protein
MPHLALARVEGNGTEFVGFLAGTGTQFGGVHRGIVHDEHDSHQSARALPG